MRCVNIYSSKINVKKVILWKSTFLSRRTFLGFHSIFGALLKFTFLSGYTFYLESLFSSKFTKELKRALNSQKDGQNHINRVTTGGWKIINNHFLKPIYQLLSTYIDFDVKTSKTRRHQDRFDFFWVFQS